MYVHCDIQDSLRLTKNVYTSVVMIAGCNILLLVYLNSRSRFLLTDPPITMGLEIYKLYTTRNMSSATFSTTMNTMAATKFW